MALASCALLLGSCVSRLEFPAPIKLLGPITDLTANLGLISGGDATCADILALGVSLNQDLIAGVPSAHGLYKLPAGSSTWEALGQGAGSAVVNNDPYSIVFDPANPSTFWESGIHSANGVYITRDSGQTFQYSPGSTNNDLVSIDFSDPDRKVWFAGNHESGTHAQVTSNGGASWTDIALNLPATAGDTSWALVVTTTTWLLGSNAGSAPGIFRSTDSGNTWQQVSTTPVHSSPLVAHDGTIYWMAEMSKGVVRSTDKGVTWSAPLAPGATVALVAGLVELPSGRLLAMNKNYLIISDDHAETWTPIAEPPTAPFGVAYSSARGAILLWYNNDCLVTGDHPGALLSIPFDDATQ